MAKIMTVQEEPAKARVKIEETILDLLDFVAAVTQESQYRKDILYRIDVATDLIKRQSLFDEKARQYLAFAYRHIQFEEARYRHEQRFIRVIQESGWELGGAEDDRSGNVRKPASDVS